MGRGIPGRLVRGWGRPGGLSGAPLGCPRGCPGQAVLSSFLSMGCPEGCPGIPSAWILSIGHRRDIGGVWASRVHGCAAPAER
eukprot:7590743-Pyramimonas_sp.AAC.1